MWLTVTCALIFSFFDYGVSIEFRRVPGGLPVRIEEYPYVVGLWNNKNACTASIIGSRTILTAAHCFSNNKNVKWMYVFVGSAYIFSNNSVRHKVIDFVPHPEYGELDTSSKWPYASNDIALLFLEKDIVFGPRAKKAILADSGKWMNPKYKNFEMVGYGKSALESVVPYDGLRRTVVRYVPHDECAKERYISIPELTTLTKDMACFISATGKSTACNGDSGSSLLWKGQIVGIASYYRGPPCDVSAYTVYCNVWMMRDWIKNTWQGFRTKYQCKG